MKKALVPLVLLALLGSLWPATTRANTTDCGAPGPAEVAAVKAAADRLMQVHVLIGDASGALGDPPPTLTRAQLAVMLVRAMDRDAEASARKGEAAFSDTASHWASGYIALLQAEGVVRGRSDGSFAPDHWATVGEAAILLARLLRLGADLTPEAAAATLQQTGLTLPAGCAAEQFVNAQRFYFLLDLALQTPVYRRLGITAPLPGPACATREACNQELVAALRRFGTGNIFGPFEPGLNFPHEVFSRAMAARMLVVALGRRAEADGRRSEAAFPDMAGHWAAGDVALLQAEGVLRGEGDGRFHPNDKLRVGEGEVLLARLLRLGSELTPEQADALLQASGMHWSWDLGSPVSFETYGHFLPLLDQTLRTPYYARFRAGAA